MYKVAPLLYEEGREYRLIFACICIKKPWIIYKKLNYELMAGEIKVDRECVGITFHCIYSGSFL